MGVPRRRDDGSETEKSCRALRHGACAATLMSVMSVTSGAITPGEPFVVAPGQGAPFTNVSVSGANCIGQSASTELEDLSGDDLPGGTGTIPGAFIGFFGTPDGSGNWSGSFTIPPIVPAGEYRVVAGCGADAYAPQPFTVLPGELASLSVSPTQGTAGTDFYVTVAGTLCRGTDPSVDVGVFDPTLETADEFVARVSVTPDARQGRGRHRSRSRPARPRGSTESACSACSAATSSSCTCRLRRSCSIWSRPSFTG